jgi:hypothetical protein
MELLIALGAIVALDIIALQFGYDSREGHAIDHHDRALTAARNGDLRLYRDEIARMERDIVRGTWPRF